MKLNSKHSQETKEKMRQSKLKNPTKYWQGKKMSEATKEKLRQAKLKNPTRYWLGKASSVKQETKEKISKSLKELYERKRQEEFDSTTL